MPLYFFDIADGDKQLRDDEGVDLPDYAAARDAALGALPDMARDKLPAGDRHALMVHVRDENGTLVHSATLDLVGTWHVPKATS